MKTYHNEDNKKKKTKIASKFFFWSFSNKVVRFRKIAILQPSFSNKLFLKLNLSVVLIRTVYNIYQKMISARVVVLN